MDLEILRLSGNILEQRVLDELEYSRARLTLSRDFMRARQCYEQILQLDPRSTVAFIDLGDHYRYLDAFDRAFACYEQALALLCEGEHRIGLRAELEELLDACDDLLREKQEATRATRLRNACEELLRRS